MAAAAYVRLAAVTASATGRIVEIEAHGLGSPWSPLRILSSKDLSNGLERPRGEAIPGVQQLWLGEDGGCAADEV